jgi:signal transduction histidine kinase
MVHVHVSIEDTGTGVDPSNLERVFAAHFTTKGHGLGMGLAICRSIIENHNGRIGCRRASPEARFSISNCR